MTRSRGSGALQRKAAGRRDRASAIVLVAITIIAAGLTSRWVYRRFQHARYERRVATAYIQTTCQVVSREVRTSTHTGPAHGRDRHRDSHAYFEAAIKYSYRVQDRAFESDRYSPTPPAEHERARIEEALKRFDVGKSYPCWYDPDSPQDAVLLKD